MKRVSLPNTVVREYDHALGFPKEDKFCDLHFKAVNGIIITQQQARKNSNLIRRVFVYICLLFFFFLICLFLRWLVIA